MHPQTLAMRLAATTASAALAAATLVAAGLAASPTATAAELPPPPTGVVYASDVPWSSMTNGWGPAELDMSNGGQALADANRAPLTIGGTVYAKGLGTHAASSITYNLGGQCRQFLAQVGVDDTQGDRGRVDFKVLVDGVERFAGERKGTDGALPVNVDLRGGTTLQLKVEAGPEGNGNDHADWADAKINCSDAFLAAPLRIEGSAGTNLNSLVPGTPATVVVRDLQPLSSVSLSLQGENVADAVADATGVATITFVVPAGATGGSTELVATGTGPFDVATTGRIGALIVQLSDAKFYVDCSAATPGDGTQASPFNSIAQVNGHGAFNAGESVLFRAGTDCTGALTPAGTGVADHPITLSSYGDGGKPTINGNGAVAAIQITNASHWTVSGLHVVNPSDTPVRRVGILFENSGTAQTAGIVVSGNHVEDVAGWRNKATNGAGFAQSAGIMVRTWGKGSVDGITITDNEVNDAAGGGVKISAPDTTERYNTKVYVARNKIHDVGGDAIVIHNSDAPLIEYNSGLNLGQGAHPYEGGNFAGMWPYNSKNPVFQFNVVGNSSTSVYDSTAWDCDMKIVGTCLFQYNYSYGNAGGFYLNCVSNCGGGATAANVVLRYNIAQDDCRLGGSSSGTGKHYIYNNTFYCPSRVFLDDMTGSREVRNNLFVAPGGGLKAASAVYANNAYFGGILPPAGETGSVLGDPRLVAGGSGQTTLSVPGYRLLSGSPLLGAGVQINDDGGRDFFGNPTSGAGSVGAPNIGAYQGPGVAPAALPFSSLVNQTSVANAANPRNGAVTADRRTFSEEALAAAGFGSGERYSAFGVSSVWHPTAVGTPDTLKAAGQEVAVSGKGRTLLVTGFSTGNVSSGVATVHFTNGQSRQVTLSLPNWLSGVASDTSVVVATSAYHQRHTQAYIGGSSTVVRVDEPARVFATKIDIPPAFEVSSVTLPQGSALVDEGLNIMDIAVGNLPVGLG
ncbi:NPCBM/NEW2 domain-containing protein [Paenarthrobacter aromaticivorans]|uniref:NPCBM/NEW2 domain-containing protein n=1 Tax=Paenarthrobacter aromaticivorans TaxID=2849150 RepID=A0ABS6I4F5_9MICC|nr:NPCBM/NEW2 domain-containing protein [Paenarthrobacter sp. MMS21-TAE1-1]MBU8866613.1 NPCBM/NEW2 domain-containing protein [Paenarthrobacter sp. MMS21-TAE1-1]